MLHNMYISTARVWLLLLLALNSHGCLITWFVWNVKSHYLWIQLARILGAAIYVLLT